MAEIRSKEIVMIALNEIMLDPKNRNQHSDEQIEMLAKIIEYQGFRDPITVSNQTGLCKSGEGRVLAAQRIKLKEIPVIYQDFDSEEQETAYGISANAISSWSNLDLSGVNADLPEMGPDFDIDLLGIKNFNLDYLPEIENKSKELMEEDFDKFDHECPKCGFEWDDNGTT